MQGNGNLYYQGLRNSCSNNLIWGDPAKSSKLNVAHLCKRKLSEQWLSSRAILAILLPLRLSGIQLWCTPVELVGIHWKLRFRSQEVLIERGYGWGPRSKATLKKVSIVGQLIFVYLILHQTWNLSQGKEELTFF